ncbi:pyridoxal phosphate-dependent aminotransferase [Mesorhizobium sp. M1A.F.Ca.IN.020.06.1.1]|uniref:MalY/PatB family protein n=1 Tax=unclassified Mesorhizobium TaxID=325217 RepID=UPI000FCB7B5C|nr:MULTISPECIES: MalY/PatB family protein [unclassified Mesorhizobium]RUW37409.1 pyridoxal phosphate-dependent aminotransferase [Mesorhizobium sp. M1A.F.Ca.IN.020.06.1.1]RUV07542.1 pyridoxal phosphate-dependent aminotransferase [Mesorhizobium sp. M1A.F.Ca.IN.020.03.2.1]RUV84073.1 pyridoxal phosphate-dependent aminotransferase [Mesorhizobium sp. M1A.F.Ca.IN.020.32.1.1]RUW14588.1 pyridoxal phosphate-dependent aminotransferase [Mesorhizobium sp. M1A.F.Ca.IN.022.05.2.1]RWF83717.1 MAG: pyridoxal ph
MTCADTSNPSIAAASLAGVDFDQIHDRQQFGSVKWANQWDEFSPRVEGQGLLSLWTADMDFRAPETVVTRLREAADHGIYGYTRRDPRHYEIVQSWFARRHNWSPELESLLPAPAIMPSVATVLRTFTKPGDGVIVQAPVYSPYFEVIQGNGRVLLTNRLKLEDNKYELDLDHFETLAASGAKAFLLCNPHNPAGKAWRLDELTALNAICERYGVLVISDDIHCDIRLSDRPHIVFSSISEDAAEKSFICTAPTKTFNLAGIPSATISVANKKRRGELLAAMQASFMVNANFFGRLALEVAYSTGAPWLDQLTRYIGGNIELVYEFAREHLPGIAPMRPDASFLVWLDARALDRRVEGVQKFFVNRAGVNLYDGRVYGPGGEGFIRLNVGCPRPLLQRALERMANALMSS